MKSTITYADITTSDFLVSFSEGTLDGYVQNGHTFNDPYATIFSVAPYFDGVHTFQRVRFIDEWGSNRTLDRLPTESVVVSDIQTEPVVPTVTGVTTTLTYSDGTTVTYTGTKQ